MFTTVRITEKLYDRLVDVSGKFGVPIATIWRKALRKWSKTGAGLVVTDQNPDVTASGPVVQRVHADKYLLEGRSSKDLRAILDWYLVPHEEAPNPRPARLKLDPRDKDVTYYTECDE